MQAGSLPMKLLRPGTFLTFAPLLFPFFLVAKEPAHLADALTHFVERSELAGAVAMVVNRKKDDDLFHRNRSYQGKTHGRNPANPIAQKSGRNS
jgi:hypothetical protein